MQLNDKYKNEVWNDENNNKHKNWEDETLHKFTSAVSLTYI